jgi:aerobic carbon-monoxide dehydrogenase medium subunit
MPDLDILKPKSVSEATGFLRDLGDGVKILAGGTAVVLLCHMGLLRPRYLLSLGEIPGLDYIRFEPGVGLRIGAMTTHRAVERSPLVRERCPLLAQAFHAVANVRVRNQATVGGVMAEADYASDPPCALAVLDAQVVAHSPRGTRTIPVTDFVTGFYETVLISDEIVSEILVPDHGGDVRGAYVKFVTRSSEDRPCVAVATLIKARDGVCERLGVAVGAVAATPQRFAHVEQLARGERLSAGLVREVAKQYASAIDPIDDLRGSAWYRKQVIEVLVRRTIETAGAVL